MAGKTSLPERIARAILLPDFTLGAVGGRLRMTGPALCPTGH